MILVWQTIISLAQYCGQHHKTMPVVIIAACPFISAKTLYVSLGTLDNLLDTQIVGGSVMKNICTPWGWVVLFAVSTSRVSRDGFDHLMFPCRYVRPQGRPSQALFVI